MLRTFPCHCEQEVEADIPDPLDLSPGSPQRNSLIDGSFLTITCDRCGAVLRPECELRCVRGTDDVVLFVVPESSRDRFLFGRYPVPESVQVVVGFAELRERLLIEDAGLDFRGVELLKYHILLRSDKQEGTVILFRALDSDRLVFHIHGLKDEEIAVLRAPISAYERSLADTRTESDDEAHRIILDPPYISVRKIELDRPESGDA